jgi:hypothetical protein
MSVEKHKGQSVPSPQYELFNGTDEPTPENPASTGKEMLSPNEEFQQLTNGQKPGAYGLNTEEKVKLFLEENRGNSLQDVMSALISLSRALEEEEENTTYGWKKRKDLQ